MTPEEKKAYAKAYYEKNKSKWQKRQKDPKIKERKRENARDYYWKNRDECIRKSKEAQKRDKEKVNKRHREYYNTPEWREFHKNYYQNNKHKWTERSKRKDVKDKKREWDKKNREKNLEKIREKDRLRSIKRNADPLTKERKHQWYQKNKDRITEEEKIKTRERQRLYQNAKNKTLVGNILSRLRGRLCKAVRRPNTRKVAKTFELIGCSTEHVIKHLESKFTEGMTMELLYEGKIEIDHIKPCASFDLTDPDQQRQCFHYTNLQPLWMKDNRRKSDSYASSTTTTPTI